MVDTTSGGSCSDGYCGSRSGSYCGSCDKVVVVVVVVRWSHLLIFQNT